MQQDIVSLMQKAHFNYCKFLKDPSGANNPFSYQEIMYLDEEEQYPEHLLKLLYHNNLHKESIPFAYGGSLTNFSNYLNLIRLLSTRDLTTTIAYTANSLGASIIWMNASDEQRNLFLKNYLKGDGVAFALSERNHGSDILNNDLTAKKTTAGYELTGEKWLIGNVNKAKHIIILARTASQPNPARNYSFFWIDKSKIKKGLKILPKIKTHGIRGHDLSGIELTNCFLESQQLIGKEGMGLDYALKMLQLSRILCSGYSIGATDTAIRCTLDFTLQRTLYNRSAHDIPTVKQTILNAFIDLTICECLGFVACRIAHLTPSYLCLISPVVKYLVPTLTDSHIKNLSTVLGARFYLREAHWHGLFQKIVRDSAIINLFDGCSAVNLDFISKQLIFLIKTKKIKNSETAIHSSVYQLDSILPDFNHNNLKLFIDKSEPFLKILLKTTDLPPPIQFSVDKIKEDIHSVLDLKKINLTDNEEVFSFASRYTLWTAAAICLEIWLANQHNTSKDYLYQNEYWIHAALQRIVIHLNLSEQKLNPETRDKVEQAMLTAYKQKKLFSIYKLPFCI